MNAPRDVPAPDLQIALTVVDASDDAAEKKGDIITVSEDEALDASVTTDVLDAGDAR